MTRQDVTAQYASHHNLSARFALHARYTPPGADIWDFVWPRYNLTPDDFVLEVGCGIGTFWTSPAARYPRDLQVVLTDRSRDMIVRTTEELAGRLNRPTFAVADAEAIPFRGQRFSAILAHFMLYHVEDKAKALREFARVLQEDGWIGVVLTGRDHMRRVLEPLVVRNPRLTIAPSDADLFHADVAEPFIRQFFGSVDRHDYSCVMQVDDPEPVLTYARSITRVERVGLSEQEWLDYRETILREIRETGVFAIEKQGSLFVCRAPHRRNNDG